MLRHNPSSGAGDARPRELAIIGGGPAGIAAALAAAGAGARVTLISEGPVGGRAGWDSLIPSKVRIVAAEAMAAAHAAEPLGLVRGDLPRIDPPAILARIGAVSASWGAQHADALAARGVTTLYGVASFVAPGRLLVRDAAGQEVVALAADAIIIATGSVPRFPPAMRPDRTRVIAPRFASTLAKLPPDIVIVGGGVTGSEFASIFSLLGVQVSWVVGPKGVLPDFAPEAGQAIVAALTQRGVAIRQGQPAVRITPHESGVEVITADDVGHRAAMAFLAVGCTLDLGRLNLAATGLTPAADGTLRADAMGRTEAIGVYVVGDAAGGPMLANRAMAQAWVAGRHAAGAESTLPRAEAVVHAAYTIPQVAQVGAVGSADAHTVRLPLRATLKAHLSGEDEGVFLLSFDPRSQRVLGAVAVGRMPPTPSPPSPWRYSSSWRSAIWLPCSPLIRRWARWPSPLPAPPLSGMWEAKRVRTHVNQPRRGTPRLG